MILRRITEHVKAQNWTAVALDFVIVVVGVFIGIQVANWNDRNAESRNADKMLANVLVDLENEKITVNAIREYWATTKAYAETAIAGFNNEEAVDDEQFVISAYQASQAIFPLSNRATYEQLVASGNINIAGSNELRLAIIGYYVSDWAQGPDNITPTPYRANIRRAIPHFIQAAIRENCGDQITMVGTISALSLPTSCDLDLPSARFVETAAMLRARPDLLMDLRHHLSDLDSKLQNLDQVTIQLHDMFEMAGSVD